MSLTFPYTLVTNPTLAQVNGLREAYTAAQMSSHPRTQVGAACGPHTGFNKKTDYRDAHPEDKEWSLLHAEVRCILASARSGVPIRGRTMYAPWACCVDCASHMLDVGISEVVCHHEIMQLTPERWVPSVRDGLELLVRNNVGVVAVSKKFGISIRFNGEVVEV